MDKPPLHSHGSGITPDHRTSPTPFLSEQQPELNQQRTNNSSHLRPVVPKARTLANCHQVAQEMKGPDD
ncbi:hypothetical protein CEXT_617171 [Caerostris extrusa]|uniref:Uncharacterized protein n=1 Tax=Caerostris extrusa TaxID=172846 RepID=A0AAV4XT67_CAEEX|nr:hypothetical protein CEXT_617171 [Caerostris extrusa]